MSDRKAMLKELQEISFTADDLNLYLDTHPLDMPALEAFMQANTRRKNLLEQFAGNLNPLPETVSALIQTISPASVPTTPDRNILPGPTGLCPGIVKEVFSDVDL